MPRHLAMSTSIRPCLFKISFRAEVRKQLPTTFINDFHRLDDRCDLFGVSVRTNQDVDHFLFRRRLSIRPRV